MSASNAFEEIAEGDCDLAEPFASSMSESLRAFGYDLPSAMVSRRAPMQSPGENPAALSP